MQFIFLDVNSTNSNFIEDWFYYLFPSPRPVAIQKFKSPIYLIILQHLEGE